MNNQEINKIAVVPFRYENAKYEDVPKKIIELFENIKVTRRGLYLYGGVGSGKTHIAYALHRYGWEYTHIVSRFCNVTELIHDLICDMDRDSYNKKRIDDALINYKGVLFFDDLGAEKLSDWVKEVLYRIINQRYEKCFPTIYTSNFSLEELEDRLSDVVGDRIVSRIVGSCDIILVNGKDRRMLTT